MTLAKDFMPITSLTSYFNTASFGDQNASTRNQQELALTLDSAARQLADFKGLALMSAGGGAFEVGKLMATTFFSAVPVLSAIPLLTNTFTFVSGITADTAFTTFLSQIFGEAGENDIPFWQQVLDQGSVRGMGLLGAGQGFAVIQLLTGLASVSGGMLCGKEAKPEQGGMLGSMIQGLRCYFGSGAFGYWSGGAVTAVEQRISLKTRNMNNVGANLVFAQNKGRSQGSPLLAGPAGAYGLENVPEIVRPQQALRPAKNPGMFAQAVNLGTAGAHRVLSFVLGNGEAPIPVSLEIAGVSEERHPAMQQAFRELLTGEDQSLTGNLAHLIRENPELRQSLLRNNDNSPRRIWALINTEGVLNQLVIYSDGFPCRVLFVSELSFVVNREAQTSQNCEVVYDLSFSSQTHQVAYAAIYNPFDDRTSPLMSVHQVTGINQGMMRIFYPDLGSNEGQVFVMRHPNADKEGSPPVMPTQATLSVQLISDPTHRTLTVKDRGGNTLLSLLSDEKQIVNPVQVLVALLARQSSIPEAWQHSSLKILASLSPRHPMRVQLIKRLTEMRVSMVMHLLGLIGDTTNPREIALLDEILAWREIVGAAGRCEILSYDTLRPTLPGIQLRFTPALVHFRERAEGEQTVDRLMVRVTAESPVDYLNPLGIAIGQLESVMGERYPQATGNEIRVLLNHRPFFTREDSSADFMHESIQGALEKTGKEITDKLGVERIFFVVNETGQYPRYFHFHRAVDKAGNRTGNFVENTARRHLSPLVAEQLEVDALQPFKPVRDTGHSDLAHHLYYGSDAKGAHFFAHGLVLQAEVQRSEAGIQIPEIEARLQSLVATMNLSLGAKTESKRPMARRIFIHVEPPLSASEAEICSYLGQCVEGRRSILDDLPLKKLVFRVHPAGASPRGLLLSFNYSTRRLQRHEGKLWG